MKARIIFFQFVSIVGLTFFVACQQPPTVVTTVVVTEIVEVIQTPFVVTRVIEQTVTPTPERVPTIEQIANPIELDISIVANSFPVKDPHQALTQDDINMIENIYVGLTRFNARTQQVEPALAQEWEVSGNGRIWRFNLRDDIYWVKTLDQRNDGYWQVEKGELVDAHDVVFSIQRACLQETDMADIVTLFIIEGCENVHELTQASAADINQIGAQALDDRTVEITLTKPASQFLTITSLWYLRPLPRSLLEEFPDDWQTAENLLTSGPFTPIPDKPSLQRNPEWPDETSGNVDFINFFFVEESENALQLWEAKQLDFINVADPITEQQMARWNEKLINTPNQALFYLGFNFDSGVFREPELRRAFSAAIDRELLVEEVYGGAAFGMRHLIPPGVFGSLPIQMTGMGYDPDYARQQIAESGFGSCRQMPPIRFLVNSSDLSLLQSEIIREMWIEELGCSEEQIIIEQVQFGILLANTRRDAGIGRPDIWELGWASFYPDAHNWYGDLLHCQDSENRQNRPCSEIDSLIRAAAQEIDFESRKAIYQELESSLFSRGGMVPLVPLYTTSQSYLVQTWLQFDPSNFGGQQYDRFFIDATLKELEQSRR